MSAASVVFTNTNASRADAIAHGSPPGKTKVIPVGFRMSLFSGSRPATQYRSGGNLRLVTVGRLTQGKGHATALRALAKLATEGVHCEYTLIGSGTERPTLERLAIRLGLGDRVRFPGSMAHQSVLGHLGESDLLVLPSIPTATTNETQGAVMQEALLQGCLVTASDLGGIPESLPPELHDLLFPPGDSDALADRIRKVHAMGNERIRTRVDQGRKWVEARYDNAVVVPHLLDETLRA